MLVLASFMVAAGIATAIEIDAELARSLASRHGLGERDLDPDVYSRGLWRR
jgi:hypothetical protein